MAEKVSWLRYDFKPKRDKKGSFTKGSLFARKRNYGLTTQVLKQLYLNDKLSTTQIAKKFNCSRETIVNRMKEFGIRRRTPEETARTVTFDRTKFNDIAYLLGAFLGDGSVRYDIKNTNYTVSFYPGLEKSFADKIELSLKNIGLHPIRYLDKPTNPKWNPQFIILGCSKDFAFWLKNITLDDIKNFLKNKTLMARFVEGFYDAEGGIYPNRKKWLRLFIRNTDFDIIKLVKGCLSKLGLKPKLHIHKNRKHKNYKPLYTIALYKAEEIGKFLEIVKGGIRNG